MPWLKTQPQINLQQIISKKIHNKKIISYELMSAYNRKPMKLPKRLKYGFLSLRKKA
jgi:hypothetical protein